MTSERGQAAGESFDPTTQEELPATEVTRLHLLRHGEVESFGERVIRGQLDAALSSEGERQHARLASWFARNEPGVAHLYTSDLTRCRSLAEELAPRLGLTPVVDARLREMSMGDWQGRTWADVNAEDAERVHAYWDDYTRARPPGGESLLDLSARVVDWWNAVFEDVRGRRCAIVTHIGVIRVLTCHLMGIPATDALRLAPAVASQTSILVSDAGAVLNTLGERPWLFDSGEPRRARVAGRPRIALSGSAGTGKTTLGRRLADELGVPFVEEGMRKRLEAGLDLHELSHEQWIELMFELWDEQRAEEDAATGGFVSDRSSLDFAAFWLHYGFLDQQERTERWLAERIRDTQRYDRILLFPWGALPLASDGVRSTDRWVQFRFQTIVEGLLERHALPGQLLRIPRTDVLDERLAFVRAQLGVDSGLRGVQPTGRVD